MSELTPEHQYSKVESIRGRKIPYAKTIEQVLSIDRKILDPKGTFLLDSLKLPEQVELRHLTSRETTPTALAFASHISDMVTLNGGFPIEDIDIEFSINALFDRYTDLDRPTYNTLDPNKQYLQRLADLKLVLYHLLTDLQPEYDMLMQPLPAMDGATVQETLIQIIDFIDTIVNKNTKHLGSGVITLFTDADNRIIAKMFRDARIPDHVKLTITRLANFEKAVLVLTEYFPRKLAFELSQNSRSARQQPIDVEQTMKEFYSQDLDSMPVELIAQTLALYAKASGKTMEEVKQEFEKHTSPLPVMDIVFESIPIISAIGRVPEILNVPKTSDQVSFELEETKSALRRRRLVNQFSKVEPDMAIQGFVRRIKMGEIDESEFTPYIQLLLDYINPLEFQMVIKSFHVLLSELGSEPKLSNSVADTIKALYFVLDILTAVFENEDGTARKALVQLGINLPKYLRSFLTKITSIEVE